MKNKNQGFTLIELLIVIAMIGVLASVLIAVINPLEMLARSRDAARRSAVEVLIKGASSYNIANNNQYPCIGAISGCINATNWISSLMTNNYIDNVPSEISPLTNCSGSAPNESKQNDFCYAESSDKSKAVIYVGLEAQLEKNKCSSNTSSTKCTSTGNPFFLWSSADGESGTVCSSSSTSYDPTNGGVNVSGFCYQ